MKPYNHAKYKLNGERKKNHHQKKDNTLYGLYARGCEMNEEE